MKTLGGILIAIGVLMVLSSCTGIYKWATDMESEFREIDETSYASRKAVEDTCRAMAASYEADRLTYEQYNNSDSAEERGWATQAKMRANKTAATYNNYIVKNSFVWNGNIPRDILAMMDYIE